MIPEPKFTPYPIYAEPKYLNWFVVGALLFTVTYIVVFWPLFDDLGGFFISTYLSAFVLASWVAAFLLRVLFYILNWHASRYFNERHRKAEDEWWARHRQTAALLEAVLVGGGSSASEHREKLFSASHKSPAPENTPEGESIRLPQVSATEVAERERQLAMALVLQWHAQRTQPTELQPLACYWQGSLTAWEAFAEQMTKSFPLVQLPNQPEIWQGIDSLDSIIDQLQGGPASARILCAGCQSSPTRVDGRLPAGEAAVLWLLGPEGAVHLSRGEWFDIETEQLPAVAERALQQSGMTGPPQVCVSFSQPDVSSLVAHEWAIKGNQQDASFGDLENLEGMVVLTLAARYAEQHQMPCAWLANDPLHTLALGMVVPHASSLQGGLAINAEAVDGPVGVVPIKTPLHLPQPQSCPNQSESTTER